MDLHACLKGMTYFEKSIDTDILDYHHDIDLLPDLKSFWYTTLSGFHFA